MASKAEGPSLAAAFVPVALVWPAYLFIMTSLDAWHEVFTVHWPMTVAMILGSFLAGSTPLGGGVVAYPVSQMVLHVSTAHARDASVLVQMIGMNAATYLILLRKRTLLHPGFVAVFTILGAVGVLVGLRLDPSPGAMNVLFATLVLMFGLAYAYAAELFGDETWPSPPSDADSRVHHDAGGTSARAATPHEGPHQWPPWAGARLGLGVAMGICALAGGVCTASVGSGSDMALFAFGFFGWNPAQPPGRQLSQLELTASSVTVMGLLSAFTSAVRYCTGGFADRGVILCFGADAFIVVVGAPIGSLVLTPSASGCLRRLFYALAVANFAGYVWVEPAFHSRAVWLGIVAPALVAELLVLRLHHWRHVVVQAANDKADTLASSSAEDRRPRTHHVVLI